MKVSIITPFYDGNAYMQDYQAMILANEAHLSDGDSLEVVLVNDSPQTVVKLSGTVLIRKNWNILQNKTNLGIHVSRIAGLNAATGDYIIFLDQDDLLAEDAVAKFVEAEKEYTKKAKAAGEDGALDRVIVANACIERGSERNLWFRTAYHKKQVGNYAVYLTIGTQIISPGQTLIPRKLIPEFWKEHPLQKNGADDYFLWIMLLREGEPFSYLDEPLYTHRFTEKNLSEDTRVTDVSSYEFIELLEKETDFPEADLKKLKRMLIYKDTFRNGNIFVKIKSTFSNMDLFIRNLIFKIRTRTQYGFNRG